jgi:(R,R)-butanediol dehydrogenase/meso-butanediol dehydrogenase/diacetyl reductase
MKAAMTTDDKSSGGFEVVDLADPTPEPDQLVVRVTACGVCGSDIKAQPFAPAGMVMGHELGGEVVAVGSDTEGWREGTNVAVLPVISCGSCQYCRAGLVSHCPKASYIGMGPAGGFTEYAAVLARHCSAMPAGIPAADDVLIVGAGGVGLTTLIWALHKGGARVTVADPDAQRRDSASSTGATDVLASVSEAELGAYDVDPIPTVGPRFRLEQTAEAFAAVREARVQGRVSVTP